MEGFVRAYLLGFLDGMQGVRGLKISAAPARGRLGAEELLLGWLSWVLPVPRIRYSAPARDDHAKVPGSLDSISLWPARSAWDDMSRLGTEEGHDRAHDAGGGRGVHQLPAPGHWPLRSTAV